MVRNWVLLIPAAASVDKDPKHKYKPEFNPPDETFPAKRLNEEVLIPKGTKNVL